MALARDEHHRLRKRFVVQPDVKNLNIIDVCIVHIGCFAGILSWVGGFQN